MNQSFSARLSLIRLRKPGLTQQRLAHQMGYDAALLARMLAGKKDLTGPSGRTRVLRLLWVLMEEGVLSSIEEADALLLSGGMHPLHPEVPCDYDVFVRLQETAGITLFRRDQHLGPAESNLRSYE